MCSEAKGLSVIHKFSQPYDYIQTESHVVVVADLDMLFTKSNKKNYQFLSRQKYKTEKTSKIYLFITFCKVDAENA